MKNHTPKKANQLADKIKKFFKKGIQVDLETMNYIRTTFSDPDFEEIENIITDDSICERDSLLELIFFPDESIQIQLEGLLVSLALEKKDGKEIDKFILSEKIFTQIHFPEYNRSISMEIPIEIMAIFISRLYITNNPDPKVLQAIDRHVPDPKKFAILVKLRNNYKKITPGKTSFLCTWFEKMETHSDNLLELIDFILYFFDEQDDYPDIYSALMKKKNAMFKNLERVLKSEKWLEKENMETLMLKGRIIPVLSKEEILNSIRMIDTISLMVYEKTENIIRSPVPLDLVKNISVLDIKTIIKTLS